MSARDQRSDPISLFICETDKLRSANRDRAGGAADSRKRGVPGATLPDHLIRHLRVHLYIRTFRSTLFCALPRATRQATAAAPSQRAWEARGRPPRCGALARLRASSCRGQTRSEHRAPVALVRGAWHGDAGNDSRTGCSERVAQARGIRGGVGGLRADTLHDEPGGAWPMGRRHYCHAGLQSRLAHI